MLGVGETFRASTTSVVDGGAAAVVAGGATAVLAVGLETGDDEEELALLTGSKNCAATVAFEELEVDTVVGATKPDETHCEMDGQ